MKGEIGRTRLRKQTTGNAKKIQEKKLKPELVYKKGVSFKKQEKRQSRVRKKKRG